MGNSADNQLQLHSNSVYFKKSNSNSAPTPAQLFELHSNSNIRLKNPTPLQLYTRLNNPTPTLSEKASTSELTPTPV
ncbi:unnamed protein product [Adineta ricciae]|uniref:Uncharacterized protein n=1 Tax=Adineta ricciae TaxID=249248 RepID=A0A814SSJ6_ADIRI|nr:unnamed protein product [Adineta ricciae]CAF1450885.1 unnamed protein product [Adineta ricciae]